MKYLIIGLVCLAFGLWATYDGFVAYPAKIPISQAWEELLNDKSLDDAAKDVKYKEMAKERNWPVKHPSKDETVEKIKQNILWQYIFMAIGYGVGIPLLIWFFRNKSTWIELDNQRITSSWGQHVDFKEIETFDKKKWDKKGIGVIHYKRDGRENRFIVDDLKYDRKKTDEIVRIMESNLKPEQITHGAPESVENPSEPID